MDALGRRKRTILTSPAPDSLARLVLFGGADLARGGAVDRTVQRFTNPDPLLPRDPLPNPPLRRALLPTPPPPKARLQRPPRRPPLPPNLPPPARAKRTHECTPADRAWIDHQAARAVSEVGFRGRRRGSDGVGGRAMILGTSLEGKDKD